VGVELLLTMGGILRPPRRIQDDRRFFDTGIEKGQTTAILKIPKIPEV
jgi:hypothetical protein